MRFRFAFGTVVVACVLAAEVVFTSSLAVGQPLPEPPPIVDDSPIDEDDFRTVDDLEEELAGEVIEPGAESEETPPPPPPNAEGNRPNETVGRSESPPTPAFSPPSAPSAPSPERRPAPPTDTSAPSAPAPAESPPVASPPSAPSAPTPGGIAIPAPARRARPLSLKPPVKPKQVVTEAMLRTQVEKMVQAYRLGDHDRFKLERADLEGMRARAGVGNVVLASAALIRQAQAALSARAFDRAVDLVDSAVRLSPDLVAARWMKIHVLWSRDWTQLRPIAGAFFGLMSAQFGTFRNQVSFLTTLSIVVGLAALLTVFAFAFIQLIKYVRYPAHDIAFHLPAFIGGGEMVIVLLVLALLPIAFGFGPSASALLAFVFVAGYQQASERAFSRLMMVGLALVPAGLLAIAPLITFHGSLVDDMATAISEAFAGTAERRLLAASAGKRNRDPTSALILARRKRLRGDLAGADLAYQRALVIKPGDTVGLNNRGVVQFMLGRSEAAASLFEKGALAERPESILNLATIRAEEGKFEEATELLERARRIDSALAGQYIRPGESGDAAKQLFEAEIETDALWSRLLDADSESLWGVATSLWIRAGGITPLWSVSVFASLALTLSFLIGAREQRLSTSCPKCGTPANRKAYGLLCEQCTSVFLTAVAVEPRLRAKKENEVRAYQRRRRWVERVASMIAGVGQLATGRPASGALFFFLLTVAVLAWFFQGGVMVHDWQVVHDTSAAAWLGGGALASAVVLCLVSLRHASTDG